MITESKDEKVDNTLAHLSYKLEFLNNIVKNYPDRDFDDKIDLLDFAVKRLEKMINMIQTDLILLA